MKLMVFYYLLKMKKKNGLKIDGNKRYNYMYIYIVKYLKCNECALCVRKKIIIIAIKNVVETILF